MLQAMLKNLFIESVGCIGMIGLGSVSLSGRYFWMIVCGKEKLKLCECEKNTKIASKHDLRRQHYENLPRRLGLIPSPFADPKW